MQSVFTSMQYFLHTVDRLVMCRKKYQHYYYQFVILVHYSAGQPYCSAKFLSLRTGDEVHNIPYTEPITDIRANDRYDFQFTVVEIYRFFIVVNEILIAMLYLYLQVCCTLSPHLTELLQANC